MVAVFGGDQPEFKTSTLNNQINLSVSENNTQNNNNTEKYSVADKVTESGVIADPPI